MTASHSRGAVLCETGERRTHRMRKALFRFARWNEAAPSISCEAGGSGPRIAGETMPTINQLIKRGREKQAVILAHNYMTPEKRYEQPVFELLRARDFAVEGFNDRARGTYFYDLTDPYVLARSKKLVGRLLTRLLVRLLRPWNGCVPARLDWFAGRNVMPVAATVERPRAAADGRPLSDHSAVIVDVGV